MNMQARGVNLVEDEWKHMKILVDESNAGQDGRR